MKHLIFTLMTALACSLTGMAGTIHVSPAGSDASAGTADAPLRTVAEAFKRAREWRRLGSPEVAGGIEIRLADGVYTLDKELFLRNEDSGTPQAPTVVRGSGAAAVISGGVKVDGWVRGTDDLRIPEGLRDKIWVAEAPRRGPRIIETRQLWVDGVKQQRASLFGEGVMQRMKDFDIPGRSIVIPAPDIDLSGTATLEMIVHQRWAIAILRVKEMADNGDGTVRVTFHDPESALEFAHPWPQPVIDGEKGSSSYALVNDLRLLDKPGEWYQDYPSGRIYYYPAPGTDMAAADVVIPALETLLDIDGTRERPVSNIAFEGVAFEYASWTRPSIEGFVTLQGGFRLLDAYKLQIPGLPEKAELENQAWIARPEAAVKASFASDITFKGCLFAHMGATALDLENAVTRSAVEGCTFTDIGGTAIMVGTFPDGGFETHVPFSPAIPEDLCSHITIKGNRISDATNEDWGAVGIAAGYVRDTDIVDNEVADVNYSGICVGWGWTPLESGMRNNRINRNRVHHFAKQLYDAGGIYTLSNQPGSEIRDNVITDLVDAPYATNERGFYIYFDEATDGFTVTGNVMDSERIGYNRPGPALIVKDNIFKTR